MTSPIESVQPPTHPPMCSTVPVLGELPVLLTQRLDRLERLQQQHGDIFTLNLGFTKVTVLCHPPLSLGGELTRKALARHAEEQVRRGLVLALHDPGKIR